MSTQPTSVYLIGNVEHNVYKIGVAENVFSRLKSLTTACPYSLTILDQHEVESRDLAFQVEKFMHEHYKDKRIRPDGEWFVDVYKDTFASTMSCVISELKNQKERQADAQFVQSYTGWYVSTKQTRGEHPICLSLRMLREVDCPLATCANDEERHTFGIDTSNADDVAGISASCLYEGSQHGVHLIEELCKEFDTTHQPFSGILPMESPSSTIPI